MISITICRVCQRCTRSISSWKVWRHLLSCDSRTWTKSWGSASVLWRKILTADMSQHWSPDTGQSGATSLSGIHLQRHETRKLSDWQLQGKKSLITALQAKCILLHSIIWFMNCFRRVLSPTLSTWLTMVWLSSTKMRLENMSASGVRDTW